MNSFDKFAPTILKIYKRDKEAFWAAFQSPFMSDENPLKTYLPHIKVYKDLFSCLQGMNSESHRILNDFSTQFGFDVSKWKSSLYFKDFCMVFAFLVIWMDEQGLGEGLDEFGSILRAAVYGVTGYGVLDENLDGSNPSPVKVLTAQALIAEYETLLLQAFGVSEVNLGILHKMRSRFLTAEIKEKEARWKASPYDIEHPEGCGAKASHAITPFILGLEKAGKANLAEDYWEACMLFSGVVQILDDWSDLEKDLKYGHYSYVTLGLQNLQDGKKIKETAKSIRADQAQVRAIYQRCKDLLSRSRSIFKSVNDHLLVEFVDLIEMRLNSYCRKKLMFNYSQTDIANPLISLG